VTAFRVCCLPLFGVLLVAAPVRAVDPLSADQAVKLALERSPELSALGHQIEEDRAQVDAALRLRDPQLRFTDFRSSRLLVAPSEDDGWSARKGFEDFEVGLRWSPPNLGSWDARRATAERRVDQSAASLQQERRDLVADVRTQYAAILSLDRQLELAATAVELRHQLRVLTARRIEQQAATALDQSLSELDYLDAMADREQLVSERRERYHAFLMLLGQPAEADFELSEADGTPCRDSEATLAALVVRARTQQPRLEVAQARIAEVDAELNAAYMELIPWFDYVEVSYMVGQPVRDGRPDDLYDADTFRLRFGINLPLFDYFRQPEIDGLRARRARYEDELAALEQRLDLRVRRALDDLKGRVALHQSYAAADEEWVDRSLTKVQRALEVGEADLLQLALVQSRTLRARRARLRSHLRCQQSFIELERLVGELPGAGAPAASADP